MLSSLRRSDLFRLFIFDFLERTFLTLIFFGSELIHYLLFWTSCSKVTSFVKMFSFYLFLVKLELLRMYSFCFFWCWIFLKLSVTVLKSLTFISLWIGAKVGFSSFIASLNLANSYFDISTSPMSFWRTTALLEAWTSFAALLMNLCYLDIEFGAYG